MGAGLSPTCSTDLIGTVGYVPTNVSLRVRTLQTSPAPPSHCPRSEGSFLRVCCVVSVDGGGSIEPPALVFFLSGGTCGK